MYVLFNSHHHRDHTGGNGVLRPMAHRIEAHDRVPELQRVYAEEAPQTYPDTHLPGGKVRPGG